MYISKLQSIETATSILPKIFSPKLPHILRENEPNCDSGNDSACVCWHPSPHEGYPSTHRACDEIPLAPVVTFHVLPALPDP